MAAVLSRTDGHRVPEAYSTCFALAWAIRNDLTEDVHLMLQKGVCVHTRSFVPGFGMCTPLGLSKWLWKRDNANLLLQYGAKPTYNGHAVVVYHFYDGVLTTCVKDAQWCRWHRAARHAWCVLQAA